MTTPETIPTVTARTTLGALSPDGHQTPMGIDAGLAWYPTEPHHVVLSLNTHLGPVFWELPIEVLRPTRGITGTHRGVWTRPHHHDPTLRELILTGDGGQAGFLISLTALRVFLRQLRAPERTSRRDH